MTSLAYCFFTLDIKLKHFNLAISIKWIKRDCTEKNTLVLQIIIQIMHYMKQFCNKPFLSERETKLLYYTLHLLKAMFGLWSNVSIYIYLYIYVSCNISTVEREILLKRYLTALLSPLDLWPTLQSTCLYLSPFSNS